MAQVTVTKRKPTHLQIANRAFEIYASRGGDHGHDVGDWFEAERQLQTELQPKRQAVKHTLDERVAAVCRQPRWLAIQASFRQRLARRTLHRPPRSDVLSASRIIGRPAQPQERAPRDGQARVHRRATE